MAWLKRWVGLLLAGIALATAFLATTRNDKGKAKPKKSTTPKLESIEAADPNAPNILMIVIDDLDVDTLQRLVAAGKLPNIKSKIIDGSANFTNCFVPCSICSPSRASLLTGKFSHNHGVWHVVGDEGPERFDDHLTATNNGYLPTWLSTVYYRAFVGKYHLGSKHPEWDYYRPVDGYDPRPGMYRAIENGVRVWPNVYQTKYIGDSAKQAIAQRGNRPFFLLVAPTPIHVNVSGWRQRTGQARAPYTGTPVALAQFPITQTSGWRQHLVTVDFSSGSPVYLWWSRDSQQRDTGWGEWASAGNGSTVAPNTGSGGVVGWNVLLPSADVRRQQLVRQTGPKVEFYSRDIPAGVPAQPWALAANESTLAGTGSLPIAGWSSAIFPSGVIRQQVVRGSETLGYISYMRHRHPTTGQFTPWQQDPDWGEMVAFGRVCSFALVPTEGARYVVKLIIRRPGAATFEWWESGELVDFQELAITGSVGEDDGLERARVDEIPDEGDQYLDPVMAYSPGGLSNRDRAGAGPAAAEPGIVSEVHPYFLLRPYAEGSWSPIAPGQTYTYGSAGLPAGSLRAGRDPNGFTPVSAAFDLPRGKTSFNRQIDNHIPFYTPAAWPDLNNPVLGNRRQQDYLGRLLLDRMEQLLTLDRMVAEVVDAAGPDTVIIFTSDNGHLNGEHRLSNKLTPQEESVRVPLYIRGPNSVARQVPNLVANIDLAPTLIDYAGLSWQNPVFNVDGRSLRNLIEGGAPRSWRRSLLLEYHQPRGSIGERSSTDWRFGLPDYLGLRQIHTTSGQAVNDVYVEYYVDVAEPTAIIDYELYRLASDPFQTNNLATAPIAELSQMLRASYVASGEGSRVADTQGAPPLVA